MKNNKVDNCDKEINLYKILNLKTNYKNAQNLKNNIFNYITRYQKVKIL